jgi:hypothetical protein
MTLGAVCGEPVGAPSLACASSPPECECEVLRWSARPVAGECPRGVIMQTFRDRRG